MSTDDTNAARRGSGSKDLLGLLARLQSLKVLLGTDSPEVRGWAPVVQQGAQATVNAAIAALKKCGGDNCMGRRCDDVTNWVTEQAAQARVAARDEQWRTLLRTPHRMAGGCPDEVAGEDSRDLDCHACRLMQELGA